MLPHTCYDDKLLGPHRDALLLEETATAALDTVQLRIYLIGAVECHV